MVVRSIRKPIVEVVKAHLKSNDMGMNQLTIAGTISRLTVAIIIDQLHCGCSGCVAGWLEPDTPLMLKAELDEQVED